MSSRTAVAESIPASHEEERQSIVRELRFSPRKSIEEILLHLHLRRATGTISIDLNQGGVGSIRFREEARIFESRKK